MDGLTTAFAALSTRRVPGDLAAIDEPIIAGVRRVADDDRRFRQSALTVAGLMLLAGGTIGSAGVTEAQTLPALALGMAGPLAPSNLLDPGS